MLQINLTLKWLVAAFLSARTLAAPSWAAPINTTMCNWKGFRGKSPESEEESPEHGGDRMKVSKHGKLS